MLKSRSFRVWAVGGWALVFFGGAGAALLDGCGDDSIYAAADAGRDSSVADAQSSPDTGSAPVVSDAGVDAFEASCLVDAGPLDDASYQLGKSLVIQYQCQQCHGTSLSGNNNGVPTPGLSYTAYPPNLTPDVTGLGCWSNDAIARAVLTGVDNQGRQLCAPMPIFGDAGVDEAGAAAIVSFLRGLAPLQNTVLDTQCGGGSDGGGSDSGSDSGSDAGDAGDGGD